MRAKYGKRLSEKDYENLLGCKSVAEVVAYLKNNTYYDTVLRTVNDREVHRGRLEQILRQKLYDDFYSLCRYMKGTGEYFAEFIVRRDEIGQMIRFLTLISSDRSDEYIYNMPSYFAEHATIDLAALSRARDYEQYFAVLHGTPYEKVSEPFRPKKGERVNIAEYDNALYHFCYDELYKSIRKYSSGGEQKALIEMFDQIVDIMNFVRAFRLIRYYNEPPEVIKHFLFPYGTLSPAVINKMCAAASSAELFDAIKGTKFGKSVDRMKYVYAGQIQEIGIYGVTKRNIHFSTHPVVGALSYAFVMQQEYSNIVSIIEGARYGVDPEKLRGIVIV